MTITDSRPAKSTAMPTGDTPDASNPRSASRRTTPEAGPPSGSDSPAANGASMPNDDPLQGTQSTGGRHSSDTLTPRAAGSNVPDPAARNAPTPISRSLLDPALYLAAAILDDIEGLRKANINRLRQLTRTGEDKDGEERGLGLDESHPDVASLRALIGILWCGRDAAKRGCAGDAAGEAYCAEHTAQRNLEAKMKAHPLGAWVKSTKGVGAKQAARLLAAIGDPYIRPELLNEDGSVRSKEGPRTVSALWAYSGLHVLPGGHHPIVDQAADAAGDQHRDTGHKPTDAQSHGAGVAAKRRKGVRSNWSSEAKTRAYLIAESCIKQLATDCRDGHCQGEAQSTRAVPAQAGEQEPGQGPSVSHGIRACSCSPYRVVYDTRRAHTATTHPDWSDGHSHNDALRIASKAILRDLWRAGRDWHLSEGDKP